MATRTTAATSGSMTTTIPSESCECPATTNQISCSSTLQLHGDQPKKYATTYQDSVDATSVPSTVTDETDKTDGHKRDGPSILNKEIEKLNDRFSKIQLSEDEKKKNIGSLKLYELVNIMNKSPPTCGIVKVAIQCCLSKEELVDVYLNFAGGGKPAAAFLNALTVLKAQESIQILKNCCKDKPGLAAALNFLEGLPKNVRKIGDLLPHHLNDLANKIQRESNPTVADWKYIAEWFDMEKDIPIFESRVKSGNSSCPTRYLIQLLETRCYTIEDFLIALKKVENVNAYNEVVSQVRKKTEQLKKNRMVKD